MGALEREIIVGWGHTYYRVSSIRGPVSTMMACPDNRTEAVFVTLGGGPHWVRYNSRLPVVLHVPEGFEVRFRLWSAGEGEQAAGIE